MNIREIYIHFLLDFQDINTVFICNNTNVHIILTADSHVRDSKMNNKEF